MTTNSELQIANCKLQIANCKLQIANCRGGFSRFRAPRSPLPAPRSGISLTEVLISMGILTVGLLGVAALFPVGGFYMQKAEIADRGSAIAQAVMSDIVTRGMLNPGSWYVTIPPAGLGAASRWFPSDAKYAPALIPDSKKPGTYTRPFALALSEALEEAPTQTDPAVVSKQIGSAIVIDPMGVAAMAYPDISNPPPGNMASSAFPAGAYLVYYTNPAWAVWGQVWPVRRATFRQSSTGWQMDAATAEHYFRGHDELATDLPARDDRPARQNWDVVDVGGAKLPLARQWAGDYSWLVTVVPTTNAARNGIARNPEGHTYDVSVVVFYKRVLPPGAVAVATTSPAGAGEFRRTMGLNERAVTAKILSTGLNGGEFLLEAMNDGITESPFKNLRTSQWIMLCGPHPNSTLTDPRFVLNWYQVLAIDTEGTGISGFDPSTQRVLAVRGPQWPWRPAASLTATDISNNLCVGILNGAVAVHTKTMRLESPRSSPVQFGSSGSHTTTPNSWDFDS